MQSIQMSKTDRNNISMMSVANVVCYDYIVYMRNKLLVLIKYKNFIEKIVKFDTRSFIVATKIKCTFILNLHTELEVITTAL